MTSLKDKKQIYSKNMGNRLHFLWGLLRPHKTLFLVCIFLTLLNSFVLGSALSFVLPVINQIFSFSQDSFTGSGGYFSRVIDFHKNLLTSSQYSEILSLAVLFLMMSLVGVIRFTTAFINSSLARKVTSKCRIQIYTAMQKLPYLQLISYAQGHMVQLMVNETRSIYAVFKQLLSFTSTAVNSLVITVLLLLLSWKLSLILLSCMGAYAFINLYLTKKIKHLSHTALDNRAFLTNHIMEGVQGLKQIRLLSAEGRIQEIIRNSSDDNEDIAHNLRTQLAILPLSSQLASLLTVLMIIAAWIYFPVFSNNIPRISGIITFLILLSRLAPLLNTVSKEYGTLFSNFPAVDKIIHFLNNEFVEEKSGDLKPVPLFNDMIRFHNVHFEYNSDAAVLSGVSIEIPKGSYVGIKGPSGGGKSTFLNLLPLILTPSQGEIYFDDVNISEINLNHLRKRIGIIAQEPYLFDMSVRDNLLLAKPGAGEEELWSALQKSGLDTFIKSENITLNYQVGFNGQNLSGGQKQRLSLAILFLHDPEIVILDEGTSSIDHDTEMLILDSLRKLHQEGRTIISCAHKMQSLKDADTIHEVKQKTLIPVE